MSEDCFMCGDSGAANSCDACDAICCNDCIGTCEGSGCNVSVCDECAYPSDMLYLARLCPDCKEEADDANSEV